MEDVSHLAGLKPLTATSQGSGNMMSGRPDAMSAPGSAPVDPLPPAQDQGDPSLGVISGDYRRLNRGDGPRQGQPPDWSHHADGDSGAGTYDEPSFGADPGGLGPWRQT